VNPKGEDDQENVPPGHVHRGKRRVCRSPRGGFILREARKGKVGRGEDLLKTRGGGSTARRRPKESREGSATEKRDKETSFKRAGQESTWGALIRTDLREVTGELRVGGGIKELRGR